MSTIGDLRNFLDTLPNDDETNDIELRIGVEYGFGCYMVVSDVDFDFEEIEEDDTVTTYLNFSGDEDEELSQL